VFIPPRSGDENVRIVDPSFDNLVGSMLGAGHEAGLILAGSPIASALQKRYVDQRLAMPLAIHQRAWSSNARGETNRRTHHKLRTSAW
jgi:hypothetical protein